MEEARESVPRAVASVAADSVGQWEPRSLPLAVQIRTRNLFRSQTGNRGNALR